MSSKRSAKVFTVTVFATCGILLTSSMTSWAAAYRPINLNIPAQLPQATQGKSYNYSLAARVSGGTGKPYKWSFSGALPANLKFSASSGKILGILSSTAAVGTYPLSICVTCGRKGATTKIRNTICKTTGLRVVQGTSTPPSANNASGTYAGNINFPNLNASEITGSRVGNAFTVSLQSRSGGDSFSGTLPAFCWDSSTKALLDEGSDTVVLQKSWTFLNSLDLSSIGPRN